VTIDAGLALDARQLRAILQVLRGAGARADRLRHWPGSFWLVGIWGRNYVLLLKGPGEAITTDERRRMRGWNGHCEVVRCPGDALSAVELAYHRRMQAEAEGPPVDTLGERRMNLAVMRRGP